MIRYNPNINEGLNTNQVQYRIKNNHINKMDNVLSHSICRIILSNLFDPFNLLNLFVIIISFLSNSYMYIIFIIVVLFNTLVNIIREIKVNKKSDKNNLVSVVRDSKVISINSNDVVLDDIILYKSNSYIVSDSIILDGEVLVNETSLSGKKPVLKTVGDVLYAGCNTITGKCTCRVERIGKNNYLSKIITNVHSKRNKSYINRILNSIVIYVSIIVLILSIILYIHTNSFLEVLNNIYLLVPIEFILITLSFILGAFKLKNVLVKDISSMENLVDIDTVCFDKTGTLTKNSLTLEKVIVLNKKYDYNSILCSIGKYCNKDNEIVNIIHKKYNKKSDLIFLNEEVYNDYIKVSFKGHKYFLGNPVSLNSSVDLNDYLGKVVILLKTEKDDIALLILNYELREGTKDLIFKLKNNNINIKIISGDEKEPIIDVAKKIGLTKIKSIDMSVNNTNMNHQIVEEYNIFYNVSPEQKKILINALRGNNHKVLMVGDGINDILAFDSADSSISMNSEIDESDFITSSNNIYDIINTSNNVVNNAYKIIYISLFKIIYSFLLLITLFICNIKLNSLLYELVFIIPIILVMCSNKNVKINNILNKSIISSLITYFLTIIILIFKFIFNIDNSLINKLILLLVSCVEFTCLLKYNLLNKILLIMLIIMTFSCIIIL